MENLPDAVRNNGKAFSHMLKCLHEAIEDFPPSIRALSQLFPPAAVIEKYILENKDFREKEVLQRWIKDFNEKLDGCIDEEILWQVFESRDFYIFFKNMMEDVRLEWDDDKLELYRDFLVGAIVSQKPLNQCHYMRRHLKDMRLEHIKILKWYQDGGYDNPNVIGSKYDSEKIDWHELFGLDLDVDETKSRGTQVREMRERTLELYMPFENDLATWGYLNLSNLEPKRKRYYLTRLGRDFLSMIKAHSKKESKKSKQATSN